MGGVRTRRRFQQQRNGCPKFSSLRKYRDNIVTTDASKTALGITLWQKELASEIKPIAFGSRYLNGSE